MRERVAQLFSERFGGSPQVVACAPGRIEVLGNHTDYNLGTTLSAAVDRCIWVALRLTGGEDCTVWDGDLQTEARFSVNGLAEHKKGEWANYIKGVLVALQETGVPLVGFEMVLLGDVPMSAGMSSSAAFEMSVLMALDRALGVNLDWLAMAKIGQKCENDYIGAKTGLLDQFSSLRGRKDALVHSDFRSLTCDPVAMPEGYAFVVVNSMVKHNLTNEYTERRGWCENAARKLGVSSLREARFHQLFIHRDHLGKEEFDCAAHVLGEIARVAEGCALLESGDMRAFGRLLWESHDSSQKLFRNSCPELDLIVALSRENLACLGARLSGGGFGGITIHLVKAKDAVRYAEEVSAAVVKAGGVPPQAFVCRTGDGAHCVDF